MMLETEIRTGVYGNFRLIYWVTIPETLNFVHIQHFLNYMNRIPFDQKCGFGEN